MVDETFIVRDALDTNDWRKSLLVVHDTRLGGTNRHTLPVCRRLGSCQMNTRGRSLLDSDHCSSLWVLRRRVEDRLEEANDAQRERKDAILKVSTGRRDV